MKFNTYITLIASLMLACALTHTNIQAASEIEDIINKVAANLGRKINKQALNKIIIPTTIKNYTGATALKIQQSFLKKQDTHNIDLQGPENLPSQNSNPNPLDFHPGIIQYKSIIEKEDKSLTNQIQQLKELAEKNKKQDQLDLQVEINQ